MQSENTGRIIKQIKFNKKNIVLYFEHGDKISISEEAFSSTYLYVGKELSYKEIDKLKELTDTTKNLKYALSLLQKCHYSEFKMREKLYAREANKKEVDRIIKILKNYGLIDDSAYAFDLKEWGNEKLEGKNKIIKTLRDKGIFDKEIEKLSFPRSIEKQKALQNLPKLEKRYEKDPYLKKKAHIYNTLISLGFDPDVINEVMNKVKDNSGDDKNKIKSDYQKAKIKYMHKYEGRQLKEKIISSLLSRGYKMKDILKYMEVNDYDQNDF